MKQEFLISGMECPHCSARVQKVLEATPGVRSAAVSHETQNAVVDYDEKAVSADALVEAINATGFTVVK